MISKTESAFIKPLDSLRGLFSFQVLITHFCILPLFFDCCDNRLLSQLSNLLANSSVSGFFCMSGFILCFCYQQKFEKIFEKKI